MLILDGRTAQLVRKACPISAVAPHSLSGICTEHEGDIILHKAAKKAFDELGLKKLPTVKTLQEEFNTLLTDKKAAYAEYRKAQDEMRELAVHKANAAYLLGIEEEKSKERERQREEK